MTRSSFCSGQGVWNKACSQLSLSKILFQNPKNYSLEDVQRSWYHSWCDWTVIFNKSATAAMCNAVRFVFGRPPVSSYSTSSLPSRNRVYNLKCLIGSQPLSHKPFAPILVFLSQKDRLWNYIWWQLSVHFHHPWRIKKPDFTRQVVIRTRSKINNGNSVCERMLFDST
jgi:hypothetical protein